MAIPTDGLVFYAPLATDTATTTGHVLTNNGVTFGVVGGKNTAIFSGVSYLSFEQNNFPKNNESFTFSSWIYLDGELNSGRFIVGWGGNSDQSYFVPFADNLSLACSKHVGDWFTDAYDFDPSRWYFLVISGNGSKMTVYIDGVRIKTFEEYYYFGSGTTAMIGNYPPSPTYNFNGSICGVRVYNRELTEDEIKILANEFNEDSGGSGSGNTGFLIDGLFLSSSKPKLGQKGLLLDNKYFLPLVEGSGGSAEYYRCASVDTSAKTWTGYRAVLNEGVYTFEDTVTTGLSYTSVTPQVGKIYSADALARISSLYGALPTDGLVLYAPLKEAKETAETGQTISFLNPVSYEVTEGISAAHLTDRDVSIPVEGIKESITVSLFLKIPSGTGASSNGSFIFQYGPGVDSSVFALQAKGSNFYFSGWHNDFEIAKRIGTAFQHVCLSYNGSAVKTYFNGVASSSASKALNLPEASTLSLGSANLESYISALRIYNRELTEEEVQLLASEFTPTQVNT